MDQSKMNALQTASLQTYLSSAAEIIDEARAGRMFILVDDEDRENEGDLVIPAQFATPDAVNFMAKHARGLICLALTKARCETLGLKMMAQSNGSRHETAFTVSIEAREGVTTGISAADRARTIAVAINPESSAADIATPGHIFPLMARDGGTLVRTGHTEAAVDIARLAGLTPAGVICEIMNEDGTMARLPDLVSFAQYHNLKLGTIADLIGYRRRVEKLVRRTGDGALTDGAGQQWRMVSFENTVDHVEHLALVKGDVAADDPVLVRMHAISTIDDILGGDHIRDLRRAMAQIAEAGRGVVVLIREARPDAISTRLAQIMGGARTGTVLRDYGIGAQILTDLGVHDMILLSNHKRAVIGLEGYGLNIVDQLPIEGKATP
ncbi:3,4-dihydroxy 2-butanone 4-phosphate synthase / GTP cyclohydrolase II [Acidiphilium rubrum]|jgi:3,4-dihydroxy 2-butanone 4-phosphate synthase/GTP cyclohydrolase II|uniref:3,4-dihydroxy-2-butanone 4-phosphate synthase n=3 Tax=Acidocellaceae TaxID=3385905 RepID=A0A8G2FCM6_ACIRU|nr:3,4-dihydroxy 2-butanone 4-phosphate synthase / GTP cyclohydrolase II [Acidiphilium rubrum]